jgi:hypothetical protein
MPFREQQRIPRAADLVIQPIHLGSGDSDEVFVLRPLYLELACINDDRRTDP